VEEKKKKKKKKLRALLLFAFFFFFFLFFFLLARFSNQEGRMLEISRYFHSAERKNVSWQGDLGAFFYVALVFRETCSVFLVKS
jgi:hypothetical protein